MLSELAGVKRFLIICTNKKTTLHEVHKLPPMKCHFQSLLKGNEVRWAFSKKKSNTCILCWLYSSYKLSSGIGTPKLLHWNRVIYFCLYLLSFYGLLYPWFKTFLNENLRWKFLVIFLGLFKALESVGISQCTVTWQLYFKILLSLPNTELSFPSVPNPSPSTHSK